MSSPNGRVPIPSMQHYKSPSLHCSATSPHPFTAALQVPIPSQHISPSLLQVPIPSMQRYKSPSLHCSATSPHPFTAVLQVPIPSLQRYKSPSLHCTSTYSQDTQHHVVIIDEEYQLLLPVWEFSRYLQNQILHLYLQA